MRKLFLLLLFAFFWTENGLASIDPDSLNREFAKMPVDSSGLQYAATLFDNCQNESRHVKQVICRRMVICSRKIGNHDQEGRAIHMLGRLMLEDGDFVNAARLFTAALKLAEKHGLYDVASRTYNSFGRMCYEYGQLNDAIKNYEKAIYYAKLSPTQKGLGGYSCNLAGMYFELAPDDPDTSQTAINMMKSGMIHHKNIKDTSGVIYAQNSLAFMYLTMGRLDSAENILQENYTWVSAFGRESELVTYYMRMGELYLLLDDNLKAIEMLDLGMVYVEKFNAEMWRPNYYAIFRRAYAKLQDYKLAYTYSDKYISLNDSLLSINAFTESRNIEEKYETEKKEKEILKLNKDYEISQLKLAHEQHEKFIFKMMMLAAAGVLLLLVSFIIILARISKSRKEFILLLEQKNQEIRKQALVLNEKTRQLTRYQCQMNPHFLFNALNTILGSVIDDQKQKTIDQLYALSTLMRETLSISQKEQITLTEEITYLERYVGFEQGRLSKQIEFTVQLPDHPEGILIPPMILQPIIENAVKHGGFNRIEKPVISLEIAEKENFIEMTVKDNGFGFDSRQKSYLKTGHAVEIIQSRLKIIWESAEQVHTPEHPLQLISKPQLETGTQCILRVPMVYRY